MTRLIRSPRAKRDIAEVLVYTRERWGKGHALAYRSLILEALQAIATDPNRGKPRSANGILSYHIRQPGETRATSCSIESTVRAPSRSSGSFTIRWTLTGTFRSRRRGGARRRPTDARRRPTDATDRRRPPTRPPTRPTLDFRPDRAHRPDRPDRRWISTDPTDVGFPPRPRARDLSESRPLSAHRGR